MVYFTLKDASPDACAHLVNDCKKYLSDHEGTLHFSVGTLADADRDVNDRQFHVALHLVFADRAAHDRYQAADRHHEFIAANKATWAQVRVFDSDVQS